MTSSRARDCWGEVKIWDVLFWGLKRRNRVPASLSYLYRTLETRRHGRGWEAASFCKPIRIYIVFIHSLAYNMIYQFYYDYEHVEAIMGWINASNGRIDTVSNGFKWWCGSTIVCPLHSVRLINLTMTDFSIHSEATTHHANSMTWLPQFTPKPRPAQANRC
jgi:hypothetical protein